MRNSGTGCTSVTSRPPAHLADAKISLAAAAPCQRRTRDPRQKCPVVEHLDGLLCDVDTVSCSSSGVCALAACCTLTPVRSRWTSPPEATMYESRALSRVAQGPRTCF